MSAPDETPDEQTMRVLVTWGTKAGGTEGLAGLIAARLQKRGFQVDATPVEDVDDLDRYGAVVVGSGLYANRWTRGARRFVRRHRDALRRVPVWFFSSGPLDDSAVQGRIPPTNEVAEMMRRVGALGHETFGGRLEPEPRHFLARAMARNSSGDWRDPDHVRAWSDSVAAALPHATPGEPRPRTEAARLLIHGLVGAFLLASLLATAPVLGSTAAQVLHALLAPLIFVAVGRSYFQPPGSREPMPAAFAFTVLVAAAELVLIDVRLVPAAWIWSLLGFWTTLGLVFFATWATGNLMATLPWSPPEERAASADATRVTAHSRRGAVR